MQIHGFNKTTLLDYPKHLAATVFLGGCNFRCPFCHNAALVLHPQHQPLISPMEVLDTLKKRSGIVEGLCISGGEPTLEKELPDFIKNVKALGIKVKLDTNGTNPQMIRYLLAENLLDYIAMDIKNSKEHYYISIGITDYDLSSICESIALIMSSRIDYEFRTTIVREHHSQEDFISIGHWLQGCRAYYLQAFKDSGDLISGNLSGYNKSDMEKFKAILEHTISFVSIRGID